MASNNPVLHVRRNPVRCAPELLAPLGQAPTGWLVDANGKRGALSAGIRPISRATSFCGTAYTVRTRGRDNLAAYAALAYAQPGDVLVLATDDYTEASVVGDVFIGLARNRGIVAVVTDGMVRDVAGIGQDLLDALAHDLVVVADQHADRHAASLAASGSRASGIVSRTVVPRPGAPSMRTKPPKCAARSRMPSTP